MSTFLMDAKKFYSDFYEKDAWSDELADQTLDGLKDKNKRKECIRETYSLIFDDPTIEEAIKVWVRKNYSIQDTAIKCKVSTDVIKNHSYYINKTLGKDLTIDKENIIRYCIKHQNISKNDWDYINQILQAVITKRKSKIEKIDRLLNNKSLLINIPRREYKTSIDEAEFNQFLRLIQPYFINERKRAQQEINEKYLDAAGYLNYIMTPGIGLSDTDKRRLDKVKSLLDSDTLKDYKKLSKDKLTDITSIEEAPEPLPEVNKTTTNEPVSYKTHRVQFDFN